MKIKIVMFVFLLVFLFYFSIFLAGFIPFIAVVKEDFTVILLGDYLLSIIKSPLESIKAMIEEENPLIYFTLGVSVIVYVYLIIKSRTKDYENVSEKYGVQGTSHWENNKKIFNVPDQITVVPSTEMHTKLRKTFKK
ncbi:hypothetical protein BTS2_3346 [Bacillus sp. TS-2]|nr:hypothetical protein BTS2_3346 [Bacillus sp. TS-2]